MKIFLTGATGYLGASIARALLSRGHEVRGLARSPASAERLREAGIDPVRGSLEDADVLRAASAAADGVIHAALNHDDWTQLHASFSVEARAVDAMLDALQGSGKPFLYTSGAGTIGDTGSSLADENVEARPGPSVQTRLDVENAVRRAAERGVRSVILRPGLVYGRAGSAIVQLLVEEARRAGVGRTVGAGDNAWSVVHVDDLAELYALAVERAPAGAVLHGAAGEPVPMVALARAMSRVLGAGDRTEAVPLERARETIALADAIASEKRLSSEITRKLTGWRPRAPGIIEEIEEGSYRALLLRARDA